MAFSTFNSFSSFSKKKSRRAFDNNTITGLQLWLDANDPTTLVLNNTLLTQWNDKSGHSRNALPLVYNGTTNAPPTYQPKGFNNLPTILFSANNVQGGPQTGMSCPMPAGTLPNANSVFVILRNDLGPPFSSVVNRFTTDTTIAGPFAEYNDSRFVGNGVNSKTLTSVNLNTLTTSTLYSYSQNATFYNEYVNSSSVANLSLVDATYPNGLYGDLATSFCIATIFNRGVALNGAISEVVVFDSVLTTSQRQYMEGYLAWKWNINSKLPANHPYFTSSP